MTSRGAALVTGASRGIGAAIAARLAREGYAVAVGYAARADAAESVVAGIRAAGGTATAVRVDVTDPAAARAAVERTVVELGPLTVLVNNAGVAGPPRPHAEQSDAELRTLVETNVLGLLLVSREALAVMDTGATIVNLASVAGHTGGLSGLAAYAATKGAALSFTKGLAKEVAGRGIRVLSVSPGVVDTELITPELAEAGRQAPLGRIGEPEDVAGVVAWMVSADAGYVTGTDVIVGGGRP